MRVEEVGKVVGYEVRISRESEVSIFIGSEGKFWEKCRETEIDEEDVWEGREGKQWLKGSEGK